MTDEHDNFWKYMYVTDQAHYFLQRKRRDRERDLERERSGEEIAGEKANAKNADLYGDVKSGGLQSGSGDDNASVFGTGKILQSGRLFADDKSPASDFMTSFSSRNNDNVLRPDDRSAALSALNKRIATDDDDSDDTQAKMEWQRLTRAPHLIGDWVPSEADPANNGGFTKHKDNGRPVPYRLNGHINIQRKLPWESD